LFFAGVWSVVAVLGPALCRFLRGVTLRGMADKIDEIHHFWFDDCLDNVEKIKRRFALWFSVCGEFDREVTAKFGADVACAAAGEYNSWAGTPRGALALILLLDQFPRNIYRGTGRAFAHDEKALAHCLAVSDGGGDKALGFIERVFLLMPLQHAEDAKIQRLSVERFARLREDAAPAFQEIADGNHEYALLHKKIIDQFGRFPHRNKILGRQSTAEEEEYLRESGESFGQG